MLNSRSRPSDVAEQPELEASQGADEAQTPSAVDMPPSTQMRPSESSRYSDDPTPQPERQELAPEPPTSSPLDQQTPQARPEGLQLPPGAGQRRFSWRSIFSNGQVQGNPKSPTSPVQEHAQNGQVPVTSSRRGFGLGRSEKRAQESAKIVRSLIVGPSLDSPIKAGGKGVSKAKLARVKSDLTRHKSANRVIAQLRTLPSSDVLGVVAVNPDGSRLPTGAIHAVCLPYTEAEMDEQHFSRLKVDVDVNAQQTGERSLKVESTLSVVASVANASIPQVTQVFEKLRVVSLITTPDLGIGQAGDGPGLLSGALPSPDTVLQGIVQVTPQLLALGYATGKAVLPDHTGIYPPTDRMSVITYWWGLEVMLPPPSIAYLSRVPSITHAVINFLTALSVVNEGVREILPFIRYISQFIDTEFSMIKQQDHGKGVVCAATWLMPAALVPRPWDFPQQPVGSQPAPGSPITSVPLPEEDRQDDPQPADDPDSPIPSRANSPMLLPPLPDHGAVSLTAPNTAPPIDETPVDIPDGEDENFPGMKVTPPTPPAVETLRGVPKDINLPIEPDNA